MPASVYVLTIGGNTHHLLRDSLRINETTNRPGTCSFDILGTVAAGLIDLDDEVILTEDGVRIYGGLIDARPYKGLGGRGGTEVVTKCNAVDFNTLIDARVLNIAVPAGTLKAAVIELVAYLADFGVTLDGAQVDGPAILAQHFYLTTLRRAFTILSDLTDYVVEIDYNKVLRMKLPSATACPYDVTEANGKAIGDIAVEPTREDFANRIVVHGGTGQKAVTETFTADGSTDSIVLNYTLASGGAVTYAGTVESLGPVDDPGNPTWTYSTTNGTTTITRTIGNPTGTVTQDYVAHFPKIVTGGDDPQLWTTANLRERIIPYSDVFDVDVLQELADKWVARTSIERKRVVYPTLEAGAHPGQTQTITSAKRGLSGTFTITDVTITILGGNQLVRTVTALEGDTYLANSWQDDVATWGKSTSTGSGEAAMTAGLVSVPAGAAPPLEAVQFNRNGAHGGSLYFKFHEEKKSLTMGDGCTVTAALANGCFAMGKNCHVID